MSCRVLPRPACHYLQYSDVLQLSCWLSCRGLRTIIYSMLVSCRCPVDCPAVLRIIIYNILVSCSCPASCPAAPCVLLVKLFWCRAGVLPAVLRCPAYRYLQYSGVLQLSCWLSCSVLLCTAYHYLQCSGVLLIVQQCPAVSCAPLFTVFWCSRLGVLRSCEEHCLCKTVAFDVFGKIEIGGRGWTHPVQNKNPDRSCFRRRW